MRKFNIVLVTGHFNILHPGHLRLFHSAKELGNRLVVGVLSDRVSGSAALVPENLRLDGVRSNIYVNEAFIVDEPIQDMISKLRPDIVVKGKEHELLENIELPALENYGGRLVFTSGESIFSSLDLIHKEFKAFDRISINLPLGFLNRHEIGKERLIKLLKNFKNLKVCVIGDLIIDEYITCEPLGMSQEDPTIVVTPVDCTRFLGGAGIVASHAVGLGAKVNFFSVSGNDITRDYALEALSSSGVKACLLVDNNRPTTLKQRYRSKGKSLLRVSNLLQGTISTDLQNKLISEVEKSLDDANLLVFSDFNYGCLPQPLVDQIILLAKSRGVMIAADSQSSSQIGDISRFKQIDLITPTEREARISARNREDGLVILAEKLKAQAQPKHILLKLGEEGLLVHTGYEQEKFWLTDKIEALNSAPKDVAGAGDSLLITSAMALACKGTIWEAACLGSIAAAVQVGRLGNIQIRTEELIKELS